MDGLTSDLPQNPDGTGAVIVRTLALSLVMGGLCLTLGACAPIGLQPPTEGDPVLTPTESGYPMVATGSIVLLTEAAPTPITLYRDPYPGVVDPASPTPEPSETLPPLLTATDSPSIETETPSPTPAGTPTVADDGVWSIVGGSRVFRYDQSRWQKTFLSGYTPTIGVLQFWGEGLIHREIQGCLLGENLGRGLIGTGIDNQDITRTMDGQLFSVREFLVDGRVQPYAVVGPDIGIEFPHDPDLCWQDAGAVLVTEATVTPTARP